MYFGSYSFQGMEEKEVVELPSREDTAGPERVHCRRIPSVFSEEGGGGTELSLASCSFRREEEAFFLLEEPLFVLHISHLVRPFLFEKVHAPHCHSLMVECVVVSVFPVSSLFFSSPSSSLRPSLFSRERAEKLLSAV